MLQAPPLQRRSMLVASAKQIILTEWPLFVSDLNDAQIDELAYHLENGEKELTALF
jgi:hypothetical protein